MKKLFILLLILARLAPTVALAEVEVRSYGNSVWYVLQPGFYETGKEIPAGAYDVRYSESGDGPLILTYSDLLKDGKPDLDYFYSYTISVDTKKWTGGAHPVIIVDSGGYLLVEGRVCRLYPVKIGY